MTVKKELFSNIAQIAPAIGVIVFVLGGIQFYSSQKQSSAENPVSPMIIERKLAIEEAIRKGEKTYSYTTRFTPGVGVIEDPEAYKQQWEDQVKNSQ